MSAVTGNDYDIAITVIGPGTTVATVVDTHNATWPDPLDAYRNDITTQTGRSRTLQLPPQQPSHSDYTSVLGPVITDGRTDDTPTVETVRNRGEPRATAKVTVDARENAPLPDDSPHYASTKFNNYDALYNAFKLDNTTKIANTINATSIYVSYNYTLYTVSASTFNVATKNH